jgi:hypothetical protein
MKTTGKRLPTTQQTCSNPSAVQVYGLGIPRWPLRLVLAAVKVSQCEICYFCLVKRLLTAGASAARVAHKRGQ